ncbi:hypothetical protein LXL04_002093 [Taraxacum kok-saghyz]
MNANNNSSKATIDDGRTSNRLPNPNPYYYQFVFHFKPSINCEIFNINPSLSPPSFYQYKARLYQRFFSHVAAVLDLRLPEIDSCDKE